MRCAYWHSFCNTGGDPFGPGTKYFHGMIPPMPYRLRKIKWMLHLNSSPNSEFLIIVFMILIWWMKAILSAEYEKRLQTMVDYAKQKQAASGVKLLWGTANVFSNPRYMNGAATNPDFATVAYAASR